MRKKYLSALLFGALLLASAGTFTSCSDYDDDIKNLQEQINTVVSDLESLKTKVDGLGGYVTDVKVENGKLVVTANGSTVSYDLPAGSEVADIVIKDGHLYVNNEDKGEVGNKVTVNEDGELLIDGKASGLKVGTEVIIKDASNGIYTISIDGQTIKLPMASAAINSVTLANGDEYAFSEYGTTASESTNTTGIYWKGASKDIKWNGPLGNVAKGDLLVGCISTIDVKVNPATFDLGSAKLSLVDTEGNEAAAVVSAKASAAGPLTGSRAAAKNGLWTLSVKPSEKATADNMGSLYTYDKENVMYALAVDGVVVSDYKFVIDTQVEAGGATVTPAAGDVLYDGKSIVNQKLPQELPVGDCVLTFNNKWAVDSYLVFEGTQVEKAKKYGVEVNGMTVTITDAFAKSRETVTATLYVLSVTGEIKSTPVNLKAKTSTVDGAVEGAKTTYQVAYKADGAINNIVVNFGSLITANMTNDEIEDVAGISFEVADDKGTKFIVDASALTAEKNLYVGDKAYTSSNSFAQVTSLNIPVSAVQENAEAGSYTLVMTAKDSNENEIKKFNLPIDITLPAFNDLFVKSGSWNEAGNAVTLKLSNAAIPNVDFTGTLSSKSFNVKDKLANFGISFDAIDAVDVNKIVALNTSGNLEVKGASDKNIMKDGAYLPLTGTVSYNFGGKLVVKSEKVTVNIKSLIDGAALKNFANGAESGIKVTTAAGTIAKFVPAAGDTKDAGLAIIVNEKKYALTGVVNGLDLADVTFAAKFDGKAGSSAKATVVKSDGSIKYEGLQQSTYTTNLTITMTENNTGIVTTVTIPVSVAM